MNKQGRRLHQGSNELKSPRPVGLHGEILMRRPLLSLFCFFLMLTPALAMAVPVQSPTDQPSVVEEVEWWHTTNMDRNHNKIADMVEKYHDHELFLDEANTLPLIVDFDHEPTAEDVAMLEREVGYEHEWNLPLIHAVAGRISHDMILETTTLPGVVMLELDGILQVQNGDAAVVHEVDLAQQQTGYDGSGVTVAVIDTGIDSLHVGLDDLDDDNSTHDPKVIAFYDPVNNPDKTNGTEIQAYDDQGHGTHCAGTVAGTGAPTYEHAGMAPQANLVGVKVLDSGGSGSFSVVMAGMQWTVENRYKFNIRAASMSLGGPGPIEWTSAEEDSVNRYANEMVRAGISMLIAAGNSAAPGTIGTPGGAEDVITVGALNKNTAIAEYSSEGPTEEGRVKPNIAFVGSDVMSTQHNSGDGYVAFSGTSMATPGVAGTVALMLQANPDMSPFDVRNILQETATYRECHYMGANQPCAEDLIPKNRQNNVYGHGHVEALAAVMEAAQRDYQLDTSVAVAITTEASLDNRIHMMPGDVLEVDLSGSLDTVQWRSNHLRHDWVNIESFSPGDSTAALELSTIVKQLNSLPGIEVEGNHTLSLRGLVANESGGHSASSLVSTNVMLMDTANAFTEADEGDSLFGDLPGWIAPTAFLLLLFLVIMGMIVLNKAEDSVIVESIDWTKSDSDIEAVVDEAALLD